MSICTASCCHSVLHTHAADHVAPRCSSAGHCGRNCPVFRRCSMIARPTRVMSVHASICLILGSPVCFLSEVAPCSHLGWSQSQAICCRVKRVQRNRLCIVCNFAVTQSIAVTPCFQVSLYFTTRAEFCPSRRGVNHCVKWL